MAREVDVVDVDGADGVRLVGSSRRGEIAGFQSLKLVEVLAAQRSGRGGEGGSHDGVRQEQEQMRVYNRRKTGRGPRRQSDRGRMRSGTSRSEVRSQRAGERKVGTRGECLAVPARGSGSKGMNEWMLG